MCQCGCTCISIVAATSPPHDVVPVMSVSSAYEQITSMALQENSTYSTVSSPAATAAAEYENIKDRKHGNDELSESTILCECHCSDKCLSI